MPERSHFLSVLFIATIVSLKFHIYDARSPTLPWRCLNSLWMNWKQECVAGIIEEAKSKNIPLVIDGVRTFTPCVSDASYCSMFVRHELICAIFVCRMDYFW